MKINRFLLKMVMYKIFEGLERGEVRVEDKTCNTVFLLFPKEDVTKGKNI